MLDLLQHYFGVNNCYLKYSSSVIPVLDYLDPENLILNEYIRLLYNKNWIPVSSTGMTPFRWELLSNYNVRTVVLGFRYKNICKLCNVQRILGVYVKNNVHNNVHNEISWMPVSCAGMTIYKYWDNKRGIL
ncbi:hypothetical protein HCR15_06005 [Wolbachia pipientis]|nr:hypothetical protein [Wolbachia pipientis]